MRRECASSRIALKIIGVLLLVLVLVSSGHADERSSAPLQDEIVEATVGHVIEEREVELMGHMQLYQKLELVLLSRARRGQVIVVENGDQPQVEVRRYQPGQRVFVRISADPNAPRRYTIEGPSRWLALVGVGLAFVLVVILVARWRSLTSLLGLAISFAVLLGYILPRLAGGANPLVTILIGGVLIIPPSYYLVHGVSLKTTIATISTTIVLLLTLLLAQLFVHLTKLTGFASEEAAFLQMVMLGTIDIRNLLLAGMVVGVLGVLDDVTISQAAIVEQLRQANTELGARELYVRAMRVGQDHIASVVNTLALVYAGAALPLLLLLRSSSLPLTYLLSQEIIAAELVRMVVASIGLMAAVPLTTWIAAGSMRYWSVMVRRDDKSSKSSQESPPR